MGQSVSYQIPKNLSLQNKVAIITGSNSGIGAECAKVFANLQGTVILANRSEERSQPILKEIKEQNPNVNVEFIKLDLSDLDSVVQFSEQFKEKYDRLDILLNNAGIMALPKRQESKQGFEMQLGTNHFGHFVLTNRLIDLIKKTPQSRIVNVSSRAHVNWRGSNQPGDIFFDDINFQKNYEGGLAYSQSKLANILFTKSLQKELDAQNQNVKTVSLHPGVINTNLANNMTQDSLKLKILFFTLKHFIKTPLQGAQTSLLCSLEEFDTLQAGQYYSDCKVIEPSSQAQDAEKADKFWKISNEMTKQYLLPW